tara:strand:+ start:104 stop:436 length:333 start_codon:yes stop_codon:yes gene_type:complete
MKINKYLITLIGSLIILSSCQGIKDGLAGKKRSKSSDEFLVKKKNPLVLPPDFEKMPLPKPLEEKVSIETEDTDIQDLLKIRKDKEQNQNIDTKDSSSLEESILKKIKTN